MIHRLLSAFALFCFATAALAQDPPPPGPPLPDAPDHWEIHDGNGAMDLELVAYYVETMGSVDIYYFEITGTISGQPFSSYGWIHDPCDGSPLDVWNSDSELWCKWKWDGDHYNKVGGTPSRRSFHPVY